MHGPGRSLAIPLRERGDDRLMFGQRYVKAAAGVEKPADPVQRKPCGFHRAAYPFEAEVILQGGMEGQVEIMKALEVLRLDGRPLIAEVRVELLDKCGGDVPGDAPHRVRFQRPAQEHGVAGVRNPDERYPGTALGNDVHQSLCRQPVHGLAHREAGYAEAFGDSLLVEKRAGLQVELDDGLAKRRVNPGRGPALGQGVANAEKIIGDGRSWHANMLVNFRAGAKPWSSIRESFVMVAAVPSSPRMLRLAAEDNVLVAIDTVDKGAAAPEGITALDRIGKGHKMAASAIHSGDAVRKFGQIIGFATRDIPKGGWVHEHNTGMHDFARDYAFAQDAKPEDILPLAQQATFQGIRRANGKVGTRNYIGVLTSVNCSATVAGFIAEEVKRSGMLDDYPNIDGIVALKMDNGCVIDYRGAIFDILKRTAWGYATNPNMGGVLMVGLGCEGFQIPRFKEAYGVTENELFRTMTIQETGGTRKTVAAGVAAIREMLPHVNDVKRETCHASDLIVALQCGGSDGYSGITANPALGAAVDILVKHGGTGILSETPEIYGAEHLLTRRAANREVGEKLVDIIKWWEDYTRRNNMEMNNNPSPGNKLGGLTTILEKSLGAAAKGGSTTLRHVYRYAEPVTGKGFVFMDTPGYDPVAATGQVAGGANLLCFTTGRGSAYGCKPVPSIKLATNSDIYHRMIDDMDINCGDILDGVSIQEKGQQIFELMLKVASGQHTKSEDLGYGDNEYVPWHVGAMM